MNGLLQATDFQASMTAVPSPVGIRQVFAKAPSPITVPQPSGSSPNTSAVGDNLSRQSTHSGLWKETEIDDVPSSMSTSNLAQGVDADVSSTSIVNITSATLRTSVSSDPLPNQPQTSTAAQQKAVEVIRRLHDL
jgi:hypothetical protein